MRREHPRPSTPLRATRSAVLWLVLLAMPFHALTGIYLDLRGPAHFHLHDHDDDDDHHDHARVERHHHADHDPTAVAVGGDADAPEEGPTPGWSATMCAALPPAAAFIAFPAVATGIAPARQTPVKTRVPGRLERPPQLIPA